MTGKPKIMQDLLSDRPLLGTMRNGTHVRMGKNGDIVLVGPETAESVPHAFFGTPGPDGLLVPQYAALDELVDLLAPFIRAGFAAMRAPIDVGESEKGQG